jgi:SRSO17 transposase
MAKRRRAEGWQSDFGHWVQPFIDALSHKAQRHWAPVYLQGLLGPGERKSVQPMAQRIAPEDPEQLHHFIATSGWDPQPLQRELARAADRMVGHADAMLIIDDTSLVKQGRHSVGVARQYCGQLGKQANCQTLVSVTLAHREVPVPLALRLYLPLEWTSDLKRLKSARVPSSEHGFQPKWQIALREIDTLRTAGVRFGCVLADAGYGSCAGFRAGLNARELAWAVGILPTQNVYPENVREIWPRSSSVGRPRKHPELSHTARSAQNMIARHGRFRRISWRKGTQGPLRAEFARVRVRVADGAELSRGKHRPGECGWLVCERRSNGQHKYYLTNHSSKSSLRRVAAAIKARWSCEQVHQQLKEELGLDHFEGRSWLGLHHHALMTMIALAFLQFLRLREAGSKKNSAQCSSATTQRSGHSPRTPRIVGAGNLPSLSRMSHTRRLPSLTIKVAK